VVKISLFVFENKQRDGRQKKEEKKKKKEKIWAMWKKKVVQGSSHHLGVD